MNIFLESLLQNEISVQNSITVVEFRQQELPLLRPKSNAKLLYASCLCWGKSNTATVKKIRGFYGKIPGNQLPVHTPLFLRTSACRTFLEIKKW